MTVSRALDPGRSHTVAAETRQRIEAVAARRGYRANCSARRLRSGRLQTITLVLGPRLSDPRRGTGFDALTDIRRWSVLQAVLREARASNYEVKIEASLTLGDCRGIIDNLRPDLTDGVIFDNASEMLPVIDYVIAKKIPRIVIRSMGALGIPECPYLQLDRRPGFETACSHLRKRGFRHFAFFGISGKETSQHLQTIFQDLMRQHGLWEPDFCHFCQNFFELRSLLDRLGPALAGRAVCCGNDCMADYLIQELRYRGLDIPAKLAVIGYDGHPDLPLLSSISVPYEEMAATAVRALLGFINNPASAKNFTQNFVTSFRPGQTS